MKEFACLFKDLDETTNDTFKLNSLIRYLKNVPPEDSIWAISFLIGRCPKQIVPIRKLRDWSCEKDNINEWLFNECHKIVGDLAETLALLSPHTGRSTNIPLHTWIEEYMLPLINARDEVKKETILNSWIQMNSPERFIWNKLLTGSFRVGVSVKLIIKAIAETAKLDETVISRRLMVNWKPTISFYQSLMEYDVKDTDLSRPYPFHLACDLDKNIKELGDINEWHTEWKWDGIRSQLIKRKGEVIIWSRGGDILNNLFPEIYEMGLFLQDGTVIDGEIIAWKDNKPLPFSELQIRSNRKNVSKKKLSEIPAIIIAFDLLEYKGEDIRSIPFIRRRELLTNVLSEFGDNRIKLSTTVIANDWDELGRLREDAQKRLVTGLVLKRLDSIYNVGRIKGGWWKWKTDLFKVTAVLIYVQKQPAGSSKLFSEFTFGIWHNDFLIPFTKAYSNLADEELFEIDAFIKNNTLEKFGPVRILKPELVFEITFEGIQISKRHKSGITVKSPRILAWCKDKTINSAANLDALKKLLPSSF